MKKEGDKGRKGRLTDRQRRRQKESGGSKKIQKEKEAKKF